MTNLADRYGTRRRPRYLWWVVAAVGIGLGVAWAAWIAAQPRPVTAAVFSYDVQSDTRTVVSLDVRRADDVPARCTVYVQAADHGVVGERTVDVRPDGQALSRVEIPVQTERRGVTGVLRGCEISR